MKRSLLLFALTLALAVQVFATPTENNSIRVLPAPGKVVIDGKANDWDLSGGIFICDNVQTQRDTYAVWMHTMYDKDYLYLLAHFIDQTPLNNPGQTIADYGFAGDSLQVRVVTNPGAPNERGNHFTAWRGNNGVDIITLEGGKTFNEPSFKDVKPQGAQQAFQKDADGKGYIQEIALPWKLLTRDGTPLAAGAPMTMTFEPNFTVGIGGRMSIKDNFKAGQTLDRVFTFMNWGEWGPATLEAKNHVKPQPVRLADGREFNVRMENGVPVVDWTGLIKTQETPGIIPITFTLPQDGYVSLNIKDAAGHVVRQLLTAAFYTKGTHTVKWDGLSTPSLHLSDAVLPAGQYSWSAIYHTGIGLKLRGWADNSGQQPWDNGPASNWGGDEGTPSSVAADANGAYLGWYGAEAGRSIIAVDANGKVRWGNKRGGMGGVNGLATDGQAVYCLEGPSLYKLAPANGAYLPWGASTDAALTFKDIWGDAKDAPQRADFIAAYNGKIYLSLSAANKVAVLDGATGKLEKTLDVPAPGSLWARDANQLYVVSGGKSVVVVNPNDGTSKTILNNLSDLASITGDNTGTLYVGVAGATQQIRVFDAAGNAVRTLGKAGGRVARGAWDANTVLNPQALALDSQNHLWVAENADSPKRFSVWNADGTFGKEFFGPTIYGALGGAINPRDPNLMVGAGCEWRIDPQTGQAQCVGVITTEGMGGSRFVEGKNGRLYLYVAPFTIFGESRFISIYERLGDANYKLRARFMIEGEGANATTKYWADANGDEQVQPEEITSTTKGNLIFNPWYLTVGPDMTVYIPRGRDQQQQAILKMTGFTASGAPQYDLTKLDPLPTVPGEDNGLGSADGRFFLTNGGYMADRTTFRAFDAATKKELWTYPNNFVGVHGSHNATGPEVGMIRGAFGVLGTVKLPAPIGNLWAIGTNVGEWHLITEDGFYLSGLFQPDPLKVHWPEQAVPGADMTNAPPGLGGEDFGGSMTLGDDGHVYIQAGKTAFWNLEVTGLDSVRALPGGKINLSNADLPKAQTIREAQLQNLQGKKTLLVRKSTPAFSGNLDADFKGSDVAKFQKGDDAAVRSAAAFDDGNLYVAWDVADNSPWTNGAKAVEEMYTSGDTVDLQLGTNPNADKDRGEAVQGDLRLSIGNFNGKDTAVLYRRVSTVKKPKTFNSGVFKNYVMEYVGVVPDAKITVTKRDKGYTVEAAIPLSALAFKPVADLTLRGDFGATYGDQAGQRTRLRVYWSNQQTGIVDDAVAELMMQPKNWGELKFTP